MMTFGKAIDILNTARNGKKKLENNTYLVKVDDHTLAVRLHQTNVVLIHSDGSYTLNTGGWHTVTTKDRINYYSPVSLYQKKFMWYVGGSHRFTDGMKVDSNGVPVVKAA